MYFFIGVFILYPPSCNEQNPSPQCVGTLGHCSSERERAAGQNEDV